MSVSENVIGFMANGAQLLAPPGMPAWQHQSAESKASALRSLQDMPDGLLHHLAYERLLANFITSKNHHVFMYGVQEADGRWSRDGVFPCADVEQFPDPIVRTHRDFVMMCRSCVNSGNILEGVNAMKPLSVPLFLRWARSPAGGIQAVIQLHEQYAPIRRAFLRLPPDEQDTARLQVMTSSTNGSSKFSFVPSNTPSDKNNRNSGDDNKLQRSGRLGVATKAPVSLPASYKSKIEDPQLQRETLNLIASVPVNMFDNILRDVLVKLAMIGNTRSFVYASCDAKGVVLSCGVYPMSDLTTFAQSARLCSDTRFHEYVRDYDINTMIPIFAEWVPNHFRAVVVSLPAAAEIASARHHLQEQKGASMEGIASPEQVQSSVSQLENPSNWTGWDLYKRQRATSSTAASNTTTTADTVHTSFATDTTNKCTLCEAPATKYCQACKTGTHKPYYCTAACQRRHWSTHQKDCLSRQSHTP